MALFLSRANCRPLTSPYRIHRLISQSSPLSTVSPGNDNTSSTAAADSQRQGVSSEDIHHRNVQDGSGQIRFQSLREELESLRTINTNNAMGGSTVPWRINGSNISKSPFSDLRNSIQKLSESPNEKKRDPNYKSLMPSQSTPDYALHLPKDGFYERYFVTFKYPEEGPGVEAILRKKCPCKELKVPEKIIRNIDDNHELWPEAVVDFLLDTMIEEMKNGVSFTSPSSRCPRWMGWENIKNALNDKFNKAYTKEHVCNKYCVLRTKYCDFKNLLLHTGMSYNASTGQVTADEKVWLLAARAHGKAVKQFREKGCPEYPKLCSLFEDTSATEASAKTSMRTLSDDGHDGKVNDVQQNEVRDEISVDSANVKKVSKTAEVKMKCKLTALVQKKPETEISRDSDDAKEVSKTAEGKMKCKVAHARKKSETVESLLDCMTLLQDMEIKDAEFTKALDILRTIIDFRQCFLRMNDKRRLGWVRNLDIVKRD